MIRPALFFAFLCCSTLVFAQAPVVISGRVYDHFSKRPMESVSVIGTNRHFTVTDKEGRYSLKLDPGELIYFSFLNKNTQRHLVDTIQFPQEFDIALYIDAAWLPEVTVRNRNTYRMDSMQNRKDYEKIFGLKRGLSTSVRSPSLYVPGALTSGFDLESVINMFRPKRMRALWAMQERLVAKEQLAYVNSRFTKRLVLQVTPLQAGSPELDSFMVDFRPSYDLLIPMNELELGYYVQQCYKQFLGMRQRRRPVR